MDRRSFLRTSAGAGGVLIGGISPLAASQRGTLPPIHSALPVSTIVPFGAARIAAELAGAGQPLVFLHAGVADRRMWRHQLSALASSYQVIAFDRRGFGATPAVDEPYSQTADLFAVIDHLVGQDKPVVLVGCSQGGSIAVDAALASPARVAAMVLISSSVNGAPSPTPTEAVRRLVDAIALAVKSGDVDLAIRLKAALWLDGPLANEGRVKGPARELFFEMNRIALAAPAIGRVLQPDPAWDRLNQIAIPVRVLCGDLDIPHIQERGRQLAAALSNARLEILTGTAHLPSLDQPERVTACLSELLSHL
jgi:pimeloyl-ACP methyl ester carboxylesterase